MAESEEVKIVTVVDTDKAEDNIKTLSERISEYRKVVQQAQRGTDEYESAVLQLAQAKAQQAKIEADVKQAIKELTGATIQQTEATDQADQSIQSLSSQAKEYRASLEQLKPGTEEYTQALSNYATVQTQINQINQDARAAVAALSGENQKAVNNIRELQKTVKQYKSDLAGLERGSEEYNQTLSKLAAAQGQINQINKDASASTQNLTDIYRNLSGVASGVVAGFQTLNATSALLGIQNEGLQETFVKLQASMALIQSITALSNGFKSLTLLIPRLRIAVAGLNATLAANPFLTLTTLVVGFGSAIYGLTSRLGDNEKGIDKANDSYSRYNTIINDLERDTDLYIRTLQAQGVEEAKIIDARIDRNEQALNVTLSQISELVQNEIIRRDILKTLESDLNRTSESITSAFRFLTDKQRESLNSALDDYRNYIKRRQSLSDDAEVQAIRDQTKANNEAERLRDNAAKKATDQRTKELDDIKKINKQVEDSFKTSYKRQYDDLTAEFDRQLALFEKYGKDVTDLTRKYNEDVVKLNEERDKEALANRITSLDEQSKAINDAYQSRVNQIIQDEEELRLRIIEIDTSIELLRAESETKNREAIAELEAQRLEAQTELFESQNEIDLANIERLQNYNNYLEEIQLSEELTALELEEIERQLQENLTELQQAGIAQRISEQEAYGKFEVEQAKQKKKLADDEEELRRGSLQQLATFLSASSSLVGEDTAAGKAFAVAGATINTYLAGTKALATYPPPASYAALAATIATGIATVKNIIKTNVPGQADTATATSAAIPVMPDIQQAATPVFDQQDAYREFDVEDNRAVLVVEDYENVRNDVYIAENESILR